MCDRKIEGQCLEQTYQAVGVIHQHVSVDVLIEGIVFISSPCTSSLLPQGAHLWPIKKERAGGTNNIQNGIGLAETSRRDSFDEHISESTNQVKWGSASTSGAVHFHGACWNQRSLFVFQMPCNTKFTQFELDLSSPLFIVIMVAAFAQWVLPGCYWCPLDRPGYNATAALR